MTLAWLTLVVTVVGTVIADVVDGQKKMIKTSKIKILRDVLMLLHLLVTKLKKHKFGHFCKKV